MTSHDGSVASMMPRLLDVAVSVQPRQLKGKLKRVVGNMVHAVVPNARLGEICELRDPVNNTVIHAEIVGFDDNVAMLSPLGELHGLSTATEVTSTEKYLDVAVGPELLGHVLDGFGRPLTEFGAPTSAMKRAPLSNVAPAALSRKIIHRPLSLGVRSIDALLTCGEGQRIGIYGPPGAGKSLLLAQILRSAQVDILVVALVGERGREVREFIDRHLTPASRARSVIVVSTSDRSSVERLKAAQTAMTVAEYFRDAGKRVLLVVDSVTRLARAVREIGLAAGEPPTRRGYPPSVFTVLPALFERAGMAEQGSITGIFTVLTEGDANSDPIAEETRSLLDGHIVLSSKLAQSGHYPAIDITASLSRVMMDVVVKEHLSASQRVRQLISKYAEIEFLIQVGEYKAGGDKLADEAISKRPEIEKFLRQAFNETSPFNDSIASMRRLAS